MPQPTPAPPPAQAAPAADDRSTAGRLVRRPKGWIRPAADGDDSGSTRARSPSSPDACLVGAASEA